jgi:hypothetical protein
MLLSDLREPFPASDVEWRIGQSGVKDGKPWAKVLAYITNRAIQERLDTVCGPENWRNEYRPGPVGGVVCGISIYIKSRSEWVTKWDGAANTEVKDGDKLDDDTNIKGGLSASMKRAGSQWGIGRYLYLLDSGYAKIDTEGLYFSYVRVKGGDSIPIYWTPPVLPPWALPRNEPEYTTLKTELVFYLEMGIFEHPENVEMVIANHNIGGMRKALEVAKAIEAAKEAK